MIASLSTRTIEQLDGDEPRQHGLSVMCDYETLRMSVDANTSTLNMHQNAWSTYEQ